MEMTEHRTLVSVPDTANVARLVAGSMYVPATRGITAAELFATTTERLPDPGVALAMPSPSK